ncbi:MAG TPA: acetolactate synthase small subunit [Oscillospiraceae bacterium]|nr:acetolactate synthase small subunit [Oscillospiraceae bacterium]
MQSRHVLSVLVENNSGVLIRVAGLFSRRGYNIQSLNVAQTEQSGKSRMTIVVEGDEHTLEQIEKQLLKLYEVCEVNVLPPDSVCREHILIRVGSDDTDRQQLIEVANLFRAKIVDVSPSSLLLELTSEPEKVTSFIDMLMPFGIKKLVRTGISALERD